MRTVGLCLEQGWPEALLIGSTPTSVPLLLAALASWVVELDMKGFASGVRNGLQGLSVDSSSQGGALFKQKIALLIDFDNMILGIEDPGFDIEIVVNALRERGVMVLGRAYGDWYRHSRHRRRLMEQGIDLIETPVFGPIIKNSADMHMALDAFEIAHTQSHIDTFCIVSGDSDFLPLIKRLQTRDKNVIVIAGQKFTSELVRRNCNEYISYENLLAEMMGAHEDVSVIEGAYQLLERAMETMHERGVEVRSSTLKQMMVQLNPMFSERTFGCSQFRQFLERAQRANVVRIERDPRSGEQLVSLSEEAAEAAEARAERAESRPDSRGQRSDTRSDSRLEPRDRFERFDRFEPRDNRADNRVDRSDRRESNRAEARSEVPRSEAARSEAPRGEDRAESRLQNRAEPRVERRVEPRSEPRVEPRAEAVVAPEAAGVEESSASSVEVSGAEAVGVEAREGQGRRRRGGRGRSKTEASAPAEAEPVASDATEATSEEAQPAQVLEAAPVSSGDDASGAEASAGQFIDRNSQLGRVPLRRGRLRFSARLGRTISAEEAQAEPLSQPEAVAEPVLSAPAGAEASADEEPQPSEPQLFELPSDDANAQPAPVEAQASSTEAAPEAEGEAKPKRRAPRRRSPRKKDAPEAPAEGAEVSADALALSVTPGAPEPSIQEASASAQEATPPASVEAAEAPAAAPEPSDEASAKPKRPARRRTRKKPEVAGEAAGE